MNKADFAGVNDSKEIFPTIQYPSERGWFELYRHMRVTPAGVGPALPSYERLVVDYREVLGDGYLNKIKNGAGTNASASLMRERDFRVDGVHEDLS